MLNIQLMNMEIKVYTQSTINVIWFSFSKDGFYIHATIYIVNRSCSQLVAPTYF